MKIKATRESKTEFVFKINEYKTVIELDKDSPLWEKVKNDKGILESILKDELFRNITIELEDLDGKDNRKPRNNKKS